MTIIESEQESFAAAIGVDILDVTHPIPLGTRQDADVFAFGYWGRVGYYHHGIIERIGGKWGAANLGYDGGIAR